MPELRKDPITGRWVIISTERRKRPNAFRSDSAVLVEDAVCPFCEGNEEYTPREVLSYRRNGGVPNGPGWDVRVVPNKFPALQVEGDLDRQGEGLFDKMNGIGAHEVIIESPDHTQSLATLPVRVGRARAVGVSRARARPEAGPALSLHPDFQEPRRGGRRLARASAQPADRAADHPAQRARRDFRRASALTSRRSAASTATSSARSWTSRRASSPRTRTSWRCRRTRRGFRSRCGSCRSAMARTTKRRRVTSTRRWRGC